MIQQAYEFGQAPRLSVSERIAAVNAGFRNTGSSPEEMWRLAGIAALVVLAGALAAWLVARMRARRWIAEHARTLAGTGLHDEEIALFRRVAEQVERIRVPMLLRQLPSFDAGAAELVRRHAPASERRDLLAKVLALRRRIRFDRPDPSPVEFAPGLPLLVCMRFGRGEPLRLPGRVSAALPHALQLLLDDLPEAREVAPVLRAGQEVTLVVKRGVVLAEARVRIRGLGEGPLPPLLVDRPIGFSPARVRIVWQGADERVRVELVERFSDRLTSDDTPTVDARIVATASEGLLIRFPAKRPRAGEAIRVLDGPRAGHYRGYALLETKGNSGEIFVIRRTGERNEAPAVLAVPSGEPIHEPAARA